ncbi:alpha/beta hydrolase [Nocardia sp. CDC160]|uniref:alpha/beta hydrolase n=1 Tax=Nocardia sp. CDC160 TaxID=3112166 RepID=UPI002DBED1C5|nr:alpha/beta hydrolase-fold protein [Nocardia sp. CDC160]MEC3919359.1 alpha/beta hydrolase-fold protein [Nocardia sp. CDC160]
MIRTATVALGALLAAACLPGPASHAADNSRMRVESVAGLPYTVLLPTDYQTSGKRYPVLYLLHAGNGITARSSAGYEWLDRTDLAEFTADQDVIVVMPTQPELSFFMDARDGSCRGESRFMRELVPAVDAEYRTVADGRHRAIAGVAPGGLSAFYLAARYPDMFAAAGSFSGEPDVMLDAGRAGGTAYTGIAAAAVLSCGGNPLGPGLFGYLSDDEVWWRNANPPDLAANLRGVSNYVRTGNGVPCDGQDIANFAVPQEGPGTYPFQFTEQVVAQGSRGLIHGMQREGVAFTGGTEGCGTHSWRYWQQDLHEFWPQMTAAFGTAAPATFDYRRVDPEFSVWGWDFAADPQRAAEFLDIRSASRSGLTLTGSGTETVTTAGYYPPGASVRIDDGTQVREIVSDASGRLTFTVDLGPAHTVQQYRGNDTDFVTRTVHID